MNTSQKGFTLAELLIALALLGIIAAFTIPKVLQSSASQEAVAKIRETVSTLEQSWYNLRMTNAVSPGSTLYANIAPTLNTVAAGAGSGTAAGAPYVSVTTHPCATSALTSNGWVQFANGVVISGLAGGPNLDLLPWNDASHDGDLNYVLCIDYNGAASPNLPGQDVFIGNFNQFGGFTTVVTSENASMKSFRWGNTGSDAVLGVGTAGAAYAAAPLNGAVAASPNQSVGSKLVN